MSSKLTVGVAGAGFIGCKHIEVLQNDPRVDVIGVADPGDNGKKRATAYGLPCYSSLDTLLAQSPQALVIATPTELHATQAKQAAEQGVALFIEKPLTATRQEVSQLLEVLHSNKTPTLVGHHRRYYPVVQETRRLIKEGAIGDLIAVTGQWTTRKHDAYFEPDWRQKKAAGPVLTNLVHDLDTLRFICGGIQSVQAQSSRTRGFEKEDTTALILTFENSALGTFMLSDTAPSPWTWEFAMGESTYPALPEKQNTLHIMGSHAALEFPHLRSWQHTDDDNHWHVPMQSNQLATGSNTETDFDAFKEQSAHFVDVARGEVDPLISAADAAATLLTTLAVLEAAESGERVEVRSV